MSIINEDVYYKTDVSSGVYFDFTDRQHSQNHTYATYIKPDLNGNELILYECNNH
jgi:hypothetical protein